MSILRKKLFHVKVQKIITQNYFVFFFQYNNVTNKERVKLKNLILNLEKTTILVCKNKLTQQVLKHKTNFIELNQFQTKKISSLFFNQGYTTIIGLNNIEECLKLCLRLKIFNLKTSSDFIGDKFQNEFLFNLKKTQCLNKNKLTFIFNLKKNSLNLTGAKTPMFFVGGFYRNQIMDHLDLKALLKLNSYLYINLILILIKPLKSFISIEKNVKMNLIHKTSFNNTRLINVLQ